MNNSAIVVFAVICGALAAIGADKLGDKILKQKPLDVQAEFVCEIQGELSERHVHVFEADYIGQGEWVINYTDGDSATRYYKQREGETCAQETIEIWPK